MSKKLIEDYITEAEAIALTGYARTSLYLFRKQGIVRWIAAVSGRKPRYHKGDLLKLIGL